VLKKLLVRGEEKKMHVEGRDGMMTIFLSSCHHAEEELEETDIPGMGLCTVIRGDKEGHHIVPRNVAARGWLRWQ
jgi:hypothetical protein